MAEYTPLLAAAFLVGAVLVAIGVLARFLVRPEFEDCTCEDCDVPDWVADLFDDFTDTPPAADVLSPDPFNLIHRPALRCFDALCKVCDLRRATDDVTRTETDQ